MRKVTIVTTKSCPYCPTAKRVWQDVRREADFDYEEVDALSPKGQDLVMKHGIMTVPTTIVDNKVAFTGVPQKDKALAAVKKK